MRQFGIISACALTVLALFHDTSKPSPTAVKEPQRFRAEKETRELEKVEPKQAKETGRAKKEINRVLPGLIIAAIVLAGAVVFLLTRRKGRGAEAPRA